MDLFEQFKATKRSPGQFRAKLTAKWLGLGRVNLPDQDFFEEDAVDFIKQNNKLLSKILECSGEITFEWLEDSDYVENVNIETFGFSEVAIKDTPSLKWVEVVFSFDSSSNIDDAWVEILEFLIDGFYADLELEDDNGDYIVLKFNDFVDLEIRRIS